MAEPSYDTENLDEETAKLAALGRGESAPDTGDNADNQDDDNEDQGGGSEEEASAAPEWVPEKFLKDGKPDYEALAKSYKALEQKLANPKKADEAEETDEGEGSEEDGDKDGDGDDKLDAKALQAQFQENLQKTVTGAQEEYAKDGQLSEKTYKALTGMLGQTYVDNYLAGVAALESAMLSEVHTIAGGEDAYTAAVEWARENWSETKISKFDNAVMDEDLRATMVRDLMTSFREANPGEGSFTQKGPGVSPGDTYSDPEEFTQDLAKADAENDPVARKKAVAKLQRSKKAGTLKNVTPRTGLSRFG